MAPSRPESSRTGAAHASVAVTLGPMTKSFAVTWDYRCPFARNANEHLMTGLGGGADWDVRFLAFSLEQAHVEEGGKAVWEEPERYPALLPMLAGLVVRDREPDKFLAAHAAIFAIRHEHGLDLRDRDVVAKALDDVGVDGPACSRRSTTDGHSTSCRTTTPRR